MSKTLNQRILIGCAVAIFIVTVLYLSVNVNVNVPTLPHHHHQRPMRCDASLHCNNHAKSIVGSAENGCVCICREEFAGDSCSRCSAGHVNYPMCQRPPVPFKAPTMYRSERHATDRTPQSTKDDLYSFATLPGNVMIASYENRDAEFVRYSSASFQGLVEITAVAAHMLRFERQWQLRQFVEQSVPDSSSTSGALNMLAKGEPVPHFTLNMPQSFDAHRDGYGIEFLSIEGEHHVLGAYMARQGFPVHCLERRPPNAKRLRAVKERNGFNNAAFSIESNNIETFLETRLRSQLESSIRQADLHRMADAIPTAEISGPTTTLARGFGNKDFIVYINGNAIVEVVDSYPEIVKQPYRPKMIITSYKSWGATNHAASKLMGPYRALYFPTNDFGFELSWHATPAELSNTLLQNGKEGEGYVIFVLPLNTYMIRQVALANVTQSLNGETERNERYNYVRPHPIVEEPVLAKEFGTNASNTACEKKKAKLTVGNSTFDKCVDPRLPLFETETAVFPNGAKLAGYTLKDGQSDIVGVHVRDHGSWEPYVEEAVGGAGMMMRELRQKQLRRYAHFLRKKYKSSVSDAELHAVTPIDIPLLNPLQSQTPSIRSVDVEFIDIGANVGGLAFPMYYHGFRSTLFEGMPQNAQLLSTSKCLNKIRHPINDSNYPCDYHPGVNVDSPLSSPMRIFNRALGNAEKDLECAALYALFNRGNGMIDCSDDVVAAAKRNKVVERHTGLGVGAVVKLSRLDSVMADARLVDHRPVERFKVLDAITKLLQIPQGAEEPRDFLPRSFFTKDYVVKMDVEGFEAKILEGAPWFLEQEFRPRAILTEVHRVAAFSKRVAAVMFKHGYIGAQVVYYEGGTELVRVHPTNWIVTMEDAVGIVQHMKKDLTNVLWVQPEYMNLVHCMPTRIAAGSDTLTHYPCVDP